MAKTYTDEAGVLRGVGVVSHPTTALGHGVKSVAVAGTAEPLVTQSTLANWVMIQAQTDNVGLVAVGAQGVDATVATGTGIALAAGQSLTLPVDNLQDIYVDALNAGDGVRFVFGA
jgi:hypothetical protein